MSLGSDIAIHGGYAVVGALRESRDVNGSNYKLSAGAAYIFKRNSSGQWVEIQKITATDRQKNAYFGLSVDIWDSIIVVGARHQSYDTNGQDSIHSAGAIYIFEPGGSDYWVQTQKITLPNRSPGEWFGQDVAIDAGIILASAPARALVPTTWPGNRNGGVYVFEKLSGNLWTQVQEIVPAHLNVGSGFGLNLAIHGNNALISSTRCDTTIAYYYQSCISYYQRNTSGVWQEIQRISAEFSGDTLESITDIELFNDYAVACDYGHMLGPTYQKSPRGSALVLHLDTLNNWTPTQLLTPNFQGQFNNHYGFDADISATHIMVGAISEDVPIGNTANVNAKAGMVYIYTKDTLGVWGNQLRMAAFDYHEYDNFGSSVAIYDSTAILGAMWSSYNPNAVSTGEGAIYILNLTSNIGLEEHQKDLHSVIYPNPSHGSFEVKISDAKKLDRIFIYNSLGEVIFQEAISEANFTLQPILTPGLYTIVLFYKDGLTEKHRLIKVN